MIIGGSGSRKTNTLINLLKEQDNHDFIDKIYLYARDSDDPKYQFLIEKRENIGIIQMHLLSVQIRRMTFMRVLMTIVFDDMIADIMTNRRFQAIIKELFIRCRKLNISLVFITQSYFSVPKDVRLNSTYYLIMKINNKRELQNIANNHSADIDSILLTKLIKIYRECTKEPYNIVTINIALPASDPLRFRKSLIIYKNDHN